MTVRQGLLCAWLCLLSAIECARPVDDPVDVLPSSNSSTTSEEVSDDDLVTDYALLQLAQAFATSNRRLAAEIVRLGSTIIGKQSLDNIGYDIDMDQTGSRLVVGAFLNDYRKLNSGAVYVYDWDEASAEWVPLGQNVYGGDFAYGMYGSSVSMTRDGNRFAVGATQTSATLQLDGSGSVEVWDLGAGNVWQQVGQTIMGTILNEGARNVAISGDGTHLGIGADGPEDHEGHVRIYELVSGQWQQSGPTLLGPNPNSEFGCKIVGNYDGTRWGISAGMGIVTGSTAEVGFMRVVERSGSDWVQLGQDADISGLEFGQWTQFGYTISMSGDGSIVTTAAIRLGIVRVWEWDGSAWGRLGAGVPVGLRGRHLRLRRHH